MKLLKLSSKPKTKLICATKDVIVEGKTARAYRGLNGKHYERTTSPSGQVEWYVLES